MTGSSGKTQQTIQLSSLAHVKIILHAVKNPRSPTHGILIGTSFPDHSLVISDVLPVCHSSPTKPLLEMALLLAEAHLSQNDDQKLIVGWYTSNERLDDVHPKSAALKTMNAIHEKFTSPGEVVEPVLIFLSSSGLASVLDCDDRGDDEVSESGLHFYGRDLKMNWSKSILPESVKSIEGTWTDNINVVKAACISENKSLALFDFEDHLSSGVSLIKEIDW
eukprot:CAMPEP_0197836310 /NCGR_PEP_ID=MMETSP1437-20131217/28502_1 /TAXON_ID=49252 ORGANISM="Eucampia antarctica, Strain CCMP1452" /NCGR_SAMPLE_ID=MMETSP1437 /ASSEMBLY_ACC=CAM_ASM_001096 /LENGTH=220 /DNA_ID=CAMNT_0043442373 /DNA_START=29 /DNA_END=688 /DNA_ORIENTATION=+